MWLTINQTDPTGASPPSPVEAANDAGALGSRRAAFRIESHLDDSEEVLREGPAALIRQAPPPGPTLADRILRPLTGGHQAVRGRLYLTQWRLVFARQEVGPHSPPIFASLADVAQVSVESVGLGRALKLVLHNGRQHRFSCRAPGAWAAAIAAVSGLD